MERLGRSVNAPPPSSPVEPAQFFFVATISATYWCLLSYTRERCLSSTLRRHRFCLRLGQFNLPTYLPTYNVELGIDRQPNMTTTTAPPAIYPTATATPSLFLPCSGTSRYCAVLVLWIVAVVFSYIAAYLVPVTARTELVYLR